MSRFGTCVAAFWIYVFPFVAAPAAFLAFRAAAGPALALYVILVPVLFGYIGPGIAINIYKKWRFSGPFRIGGYYLHHGLMYAGNMAPLLWLVWPLRSAETFPLVRLCLASAALHGLFLWIHDIWIVRASFVTLNSPAARQGRSAEEITFCYAPFCFSVIGAAYALSAAWAFSHMTADPGTWDFAKLLAGGFLLVFVSGSLSYGVVERLAQDKAS